MLKCKICNYECEKTLSFSRHLSRTRDKIHIDYLNEQKNIAKQLFLQEISTEELLSKNKEFELSKKFLFRFWQQIYTNQEIKQRGFRVISNFHNTLNISKEELNELYTNQLLTDEDIAKKYDTKPGNIFYLRMKYKIDTLNPNERNKKIEITKKQKSIILGSILGNGKLIKKDDISCLLINYSITEKEYAKWTFSELKDIIQHKELIEYKIKSIKKINKIYEKVCFKTIDNSFLEELRTLFYKDKTKIINKEYLLKNLDELSLSLWVMDKASCDKLSGTVRIYTNIYTEQEVEDLVDVLKTKFNIDTITLKIPNKKTGKIYSILKFNKKASLKLAKTIERYIIPSMRYKIEPIFLKNNIDLNEPIPINIIKNGEINIPKEDWINLNQRYNKNFIKKMILDSIKENNVPVPYRKCSLDNVKEDFLNLCKFDATNLLVEEGFFSRYKYKYSFLNKYIYQNNVGNMSSDFFQQENRFMCDGINGPSPFRVWNNEKFLYSMLNYLWAMKKEEVNSEILRTGLKLRNCTASQFKPSVAKFIYNHFKAMNILDFSAGWGDRLAGFYASNAKSYVGIDPNKAVVDKYYEQVELYKTLTNDKKETKFINAAAEDIVLEDRFDLIFTSVPYYDTERYTNEENQSWVRYKKLDIWLDKFLFATIGKFWNNLDVDGHLIINMSDVYGHHKIQNICDPMNDFVSKLPGAKYIGAIGMKISKRPNSKVIGEGVFAEPIWIFKKEN